MSKMIICRGVPASGKSTWATAWVAEASETRVRVNRDDIRFMLFGKYVGVDEVTVTKIQDAAIEAAMLAKKDVVVDNTNLRSRYVRDLMKIAWNHGYDVSFKDFSVSLDEAIQRDSKRERQVGESVIRMFFNKYLSKGNLPDIPKFDYPQVFRPYAPDVTLPSAFLFDIDGTLAHIDPENPRDVYDASRAREDLLDMPVSEVLFSLATSHHKIILVSGRSDDHRDETEDWLDSNGIGAVYEHLYMRPSGDIRKDSIVKNELFRNYIEPHYHVMGVFDDRQQVVDMWRQIGLKCFQVQPGDF